MDAPIAFESSWKKKESRENIREQRQIYIEKLKRKHDKEEWKREQATLRGEDTWMLDSVSDRFEQEKKELDTTGKKKKKEKKQKKDKKHKKKKKKKLNDSSSSESEEDGNDIWAEKPFTSTKSENVMKGPSLQRDSWMTDAPSLDFGALPSITKSDFNEQRQKKKDVDRGIDEIKPVVEEPGSNELELNPYWKDGGKGMPEDDPGKKNKKKVFSADIVSGDGGAGWWKKAYQRCVEQAEADGTTLEEVAADRYGSLKKLLSMMTASEKNEKKIKHEKFQGSRYQPERHSGNHEVDDRRSTDKSRSDHKPTYPSSEKSRPLFRKPDDDDEDEHQAKSRSGPDKLEKSHRGFRKPGESSTTSHNETDRKRSFIRPPDDDVPYNYSKKAESRTSDRSVPRWKKQSGRKSRSRSRDRESRSRRSRSRDRRSRSRDRRSRSRDRRSRSRDRRSRSRDRRSRSRSRDRERKSRDRDRSRSRDRDCRTEKRSRRSRDSRSKSRDRSRSRDRRSGCRDRRSRSRERRSRSRDKQNRNREQRQNRSRERSGSRDRNTSRSTCAVRHKNNKKHEYERKRSEDKKRRYTSSSESSTSSAESSSESSGAESDNEHVSHAQPAPKILSEQELNELGAKMVRAEIMGNEALAAEIKTQIDEARKTREAHVKSAPSQTDEQKRGEKKEEEIVLTRTDRSGNVRPLGGREHADSGSRRRKEKVKTHSTGGSRERYFADDDNKDLKSLVEQERLGTAQDSNYEFIKLAGKAFGRKQNMEDMDEDFMQGAAKKESDATIEMKDMSKAIAEHRKLSAAMEKCHHCFEKVPKHLIIAIGLKVYLCLPNHRSMTEGHCLIVPMQHVSQSTVLDEDVFEEIQVYRRALTKMYGMHDLDCVFMETCKDLHRQNHMVIECVPLPPELGDMAPIYFKKALQDSETEWSQNKKVVDLSKKDIRKAVPKGFPYFSVDFGLQGGFAHVIEEEKTFPFYFGREILGGMLDLEPTLWRKPHKENFEDQRKKVLAFSEWWKPVDWTQKLKDMNDSD